MRWPEGVRRGGDAVRSAVFGCVLITTQATAQQLPRPIADPLAGVEAANDPILQLAERTIAPDAFRAAIVAAVLRNPGIGEAVAQREESEAARNEARTAQYPDVTASLSHFEVISRAFSNDPFNILERQRPQRRTDGLLRIQQPVFDFGAASGRIQAGNARLDAAVAGIDDSSAQIALRTVAAWYNVYGTRVLVRLAEEFGADQQRVRGSIEDRIRQGVSAQADLAQVDSTLAASSAQLADFRRAQASAEANYTQLVGAPPPPGLGRAPVPELARGPVDLDALPAVRAARAIATASARDAKAVRADALPNLSVGVDAGRYGVFQNARDYDVRGNVTLSWRPFGGATQRIDQAEARERGADARFRRIREEADRDVRIATSDVAALTEAQGALARDYLASRTARDVIAERFRVSRGTLFDLLTAQGNYFGVAARYIQTLTELDTARYVLLARSGTLLAALGIEHRMLDRGGLPR